MENERFEEEPEKDTPNEVGHFIAGIALGAFVVGFGAFLMWPDTVRTKYISYDNGCQEGYNCRVLVTKKTTEELVDDLSYKVSNLKQEVTQLKSLPTAKKEAAKEAEDERKAQSSLNRGGWTWYGLGRE